MVTKVLGIAQNGELVGELSIDQKAIVVLAETPFYAESGGQIGDTGVLIGDGIKFVVTDTQKLPNDLILHSGVLESGSLKPGNEVTASINEERRLSIIRNHSSVHLLQNALKKVLGDHVTQAGSFVGPDYSRFDFTHPEAMTQAQLKEVQRIVNEYLLDDYPVETEVLTLEEARQKGAIAPFGEKYGPMVRVVKMGPSIEFCGGTHSPRTSFIGRYRIVGESSISAGVRRLEAVTGRRAYEMELEEEYDIVSPLAALTATKGTGVVTRVEQLMGQLKELQKEVARLKEKVAMGDLDGLLEKTFEVGGARACVARLDGLDAGQLRSLVVALRDRLGETGVAVIISGQGDKVSLISAAAPEVQGNFPANKVVNKFAEALGGRGGGKADIAQAGAKDIAKIDETVSKAKELMESL